MNGRYCAPPTGQDTTITHAEARELSAAMKAAAAGERGSSGSRIAPIDRTWLKVRAQDASAASAASADEAIKTGASGNAANSGSGTGQEPWEASEDARNGAGERTETRDAEHKVDGKHRDGEHRSGAGFETSSSGSAERVDGTPQSLATEESHTAKTTLDFSLTTVDVETSPDVGGRTPRARKPKKKEMRRAEKESLDREKTLNSERVRKQCVGKR